MGSVRPRPTRHLQGKPVRTVPSDYGADDFAADSTSRFADLPSLPTDLREALVACSEDPSGLSGGDGR